MTVPAVPGALNVSPLAGDEIVAIATVGPQSAQTTTQDIANLVNSSEAARGTFTANEETAVTVTNAAVTANSQILITLKTVGGTVAGTPYVATITPGTGFTVKSTSADTSVYNYLIIG